MEPIFTSLMSNLIPQNDELTFSMFTMHTFWYNNLSAFLGKVN